LLRVVAIEQDTERFSVVPDPARRRPGRGANIHPDPACLALAERRRAFGRALRITGVADTGPLAEVVSASYAQPGTADGGSTEPRPEPSKVGRPTWAHDEVAEMIRLQVRE
jgi:predicted RNA-binding protein YlxR (DUF448 family)